MEWYTVKMEEGPEIQEASEAVKSKKIYFLLGDSRRNRGELLQPDKEDLPKNKNLPLTYFMVRNLDAFPLRSGRRQGCPFY